MGRQITRYNPAVKIFHIRYRNPSGKVVLLMEHTRKKQFLSRESAQAYGDEQVALGRWKEYVLVDG